MKYTGDKVLDTMSKCAINRNNTIHSLIFKAFKLTSLFKHKTILEFGAGRGEFINRFSNIKYLTTSALEVDNTYLNILKKKHKTYGNIRQITKKIDYVFAIDVLEHVKDDTEILTQIYQILKKNGRLFIFVPARTELYSNFDKHIGHYRRYMLEDIKLKVNKVGFSIEKATYHDFLGYFAAVFNKLTSKGELSSSAVYLYDKYFFPFSMFLEKLFRCPFGKSIILVAKKTPQNHEK